MKRIVRLVGVLMVFCIQARAQSSFTIPVQTTTGTAITGASVTLTCTDTANGCVGKGPFTVFSTNGNANFTAIPAGNYTVSVAGTGITTYSYAYTVPSQGNGGIATPSSLNNIIFVDGVTYAKTQAGITSAVQAACGSGSAGHVIIPAGTYTITSNLNWTGLAQGCVIEGVGSYATTPGPTTYNGTVLQINFTGSNTVGVDISSVVALTLHNLVISCGTSAANAPTVCLLHGRTAGSNGIQNTFDHVYVVGYSPWIYYNYHGEQLSAFDCLFAEYATTGTPITLSEVNTAGITSPNVTLGGGVNSETVFAFEGGSTTVSSQATSAGSKLLYLDEGSGNITDVRFRGFANLSAANEVFVGDTSGATGALQDITLEVTAQDAVAASDSMASIAGTADQWHVTGLQTSGATTTPFVFSFIVRHSYFGFSVGAVTGSCFTTSGDATATIIQMDFGCAGHITAPLAALVSTFGTSVGAPFQITDMGTCTMASGACTAQTFPSGRTYTAAPKIWLTWTGTGACTGLLKYTVSTTQVTPSSSVGTDTCQVNWFAFGN